MSKRALFIILALIFFISGVMYVWNKLSPPKSPASFIETNTWQKKDYPLLGISLSLPPEFAEEENGTYSRIFFKPSPVSGQSRPGFIYFSVVPAGKDFFSGEIYNYDPRSFNALISLQDGQATVLAEAGDEETKKHFTYIKVDDVNLGGYGTKSFINTSPWEFPSGTTEYRFISQFANVNYILGGYLGLDVASETYISREEFNKILESVKFLPDNVKAASFSALSGEWTTFTDEIEGISFSYPKAWQPRPDSQNFTSGDLFAVSVVGKTQKTGTEFFDGATFAVMKPEYSDLDAITWIKQKYLKSEVSEKEPEFSEEEYSGRTYQKAYVCGLGCFSYYHFKENGKIFGFAFFAEGPDKETYTQDFRKTMKSLSFSR